MSIREIAARWEVPEPHAAELLDLGFDGKRPLYELSKAHIPGIEELKQALFTGTASFPRSVIIRDEFDGRDDPLPLVPEMFQAVFVRRDSTLGISEYPNWYVRGRITGHAQAVRPSPIVHLYLHVDAGDTDRNLVDSAEIQIASAVSPCAT